MDSLPQSARLMSMLFLARLLRYHRKKSQQFRIGLMQLLAISHQQQQADCLAACTAMVLGYRGIEVEYSRLQHDEFMLAWLEQDYRYAVIASTKTF